MRICTVLLAAFLSVMTLAGQGARAPIDISKLGPQIGDRIPDFSLTDQSGKTWTRRSMLGSKGAMLVFFRSADWWPYCKTQLVELQGRLADLQKQGLGVAAISYDSPEILAAFSRQRGITFPLLSDAGSATIKAFGLLNPLVELGLGPQRDDPQIAEEIRKYVTAAGRPNATMTGMAFPGTLMLDRQGRVTARFFEDLYFERNTVSSVMARVGATSPPVAATKLSTAHLDVVAFPSDAAVAPGNRFSLIFDVAPHRDMHVYAPGATSYRVVAISVAAQPFLRLQPLTYPQAEIYFFKPLNERVPVYRKPFRLVQEVLLEGTAQAQTALQGKDSLPITASLEYQACDENTCYNPATIPVSFTLSLRSLIRERPQVR